MSENDFDPSLVSDNKSAVAVFAQAIRQVYRGELGGQRFHAVVLAPPEDIAGGSGDRTFFKYKGRIVKAENNAPIPNPHAVLPDPCTLDQAKTPAARTAINDAIRLHTTFYSTYMSSQTKPRGGDVVAVSLKLGTNGSWALDSGEHLGRIRVGVPAKLKAECKSLEDAVKQSDAKAPKMKTTVTNAAKWVKCFSGINVSTGEQNGRVQFKFKQGGGDSLSLHGDAVAKDLEDWINVRSPSRLGAGTVTVENQWDVRTLNQVVQDNRKSASEKAALPHRSSYSVHVIRTGVDVSISVNTNFHNFYTISSKIDANTDTDWRKKVANEPTLVALLQTYAPAKGTYFYFDEKEKKAGVPSDFVPREKLVDGPHAGQLGEYSGAPSDLERAAGPTGRNRYGPLIYGYPFVWGGNFLGGDRSNIMPPGYVADNDTVMIDEVGHFELNPDVYGTAVNKVNVDCQNAIKDAVGFGFEDLYEVGKRQTLYKVWLRDLFSVSG